MHNRYKWLPSTSCANRFLYRDSTASLSVRTISWTACICTLMLPTDFPHWRFLADHLCIRSHVHRVIRLLIAGS